RPPSLSPDESRPPRRAVPYPGIAGKRNSSRVGSGDGQGNGDGRALGADAAVVALGGGLDDRQADPRAVALARAVRAPEALEGELLLARGEPLALVADQHPGDAVLELQREVDLAAGRAVQCRVLEQVLDAASQRVLLADHRRPSRDRGPHPAPPLP